MTLSRKIKKHFSRRPVNSHARSRTSERRNTKARKIEQLERFRSRLYKRNYADSYSESFRPQQDLSSRAFRYLIFFRSVEHAFCRPQVVLVRAAHRRHRIDPQAAVVAKIQPCARKQSSAPPRWIGASPEGFRTLGGAAGHQSVLSNARCLHWPARVAAGSL